MKKKIMIGGIIICVLLLSGCTTKLKDGKEAVVTLSSGDIATEELYDMLKDKYGADKLIELIDTKLLEKEYGSKDTESVKKYVDDQIASAKSEAEKNSMEYEDYITQYYGLNNEEDLKAYFKLNYRRNIWVEDYIMSKISDKEVKAYYDESITGDMDLSHILITPKVDSNATDEVKSKAEKEAKAKAEEVIAKLNKGGDFKKLAEEYSEDESNAKKGGALGYINRDGYDENFIEGAIPLKDKSYTKSPIKTQFGYHIIYKSKTKKKPSLKDKEDDIRKIISQEKFSNDPKLSVTAIEELRKKYKMEIKDSELKKSYKNTMTKLYEQASSSNDK